MYKQGNMDKRIAIIVVLALGMLVVLQSPLSAQAAAKAYSTGTPGVKSSFSDVSGNDPEYVYINYISQRNIMKGFPDGSYHPGEGLTRAQAAVVLVKAAGVETINVEKSSFMDVPLNHWAIAYIQAAVKAGYIHGFPDETFRPDAKLTRAQGISLVMRLSSQKDRAILPALSDITADHWAAADVATALELKMIGISKDANRVYPEADMNRAELARALSILLTYDPVLNKTSLIGKIQDPHGVITRTRNGITISLKKDMDIVEGDVLKSGKGSKATIAFPDGSSTLMEEDSEIMVKESSGRSYIRLDGTPGVAIDYLNVEIKQGTLFGALATKHEENNKISGLNHHFAGGDSLKLLAAAGKDKEQPWYKTAEQKRVRVKVDMPWGIAAIRGTFYRVSVNVDGSCKVACLTGSADVSSKSGSTVSLSGNQSSSITTPSDHPTSATAMSKDEVNGFSEEQQWVVDTALNIDTKQAAPLVEIVVEAEDISNENLNQDKVSTVLEVIVNALGTSGVKLNSETVESIKNQLEQIEKQATVNPYRDTDILGKTEQTAANTTTRTSDSSGSSGIVSLTLSQAGTYGSPTAGSPTYADTVLIDAEGVVLQNMVISSSLTVNCANTILKGLTINGNLLLASGIAEGDVTLQNVTVKGSTIVNGGGVSSIHIADSNLNTVDVNKANNAIRLAAESKTVIGTLTLGSGATLDESGLTSGYAGFSTILTGSSISSGAVIVLKGNFQSFDVSRPGLNIEIGSGSISQLNIAAAASNTSLNMLAGSNVQSFTANAPANVVGSGSIVNAQIYTNGVNISNTPGNLYIGSDLAASIGGTTVDGANSSDYTFTVADGGATITGYSGTGTDIFLPDKLGGVPVIAIGDSAFASNISLISLAIPASVNNLGETPFWDCPALTSLKVDANNGAFCSLNGLLYSRDRTQVVACPSGLTTVTMPEGITNIGPGAFRKCSKLTAITIPASVTTISDYAFEDCYGLTNATIQGRVTRIGDYAFSGTRFESLILPDSLTSIGVEAFSGCSLTTLDIPDSVTTIGNQAFYGSVISSITLPANIDSIGEGVFESCEDLTGITIPDSVTSIGDCAFRESGLTSITIPDGVTSIGYRAFISCSDLTSVNLPDSVTTIGEEAFCNCWQVTSIHLPTHLTAIQRSTFSGCNGLTSIDIPASVSTIGDYAFNECYAVTSLNISEGVTTIGDCAFSNLQNLTSVTIPSSVTSIGTESFLYCIRLTKVTMGYGLTNLPYGVFYHCPELSSINLPASLISIGESAIRDIKPNVIIAIPASVTSINSRNYGFGSVIQGYSGSYAETFATGKTFVALGTFNITYDMNGGSGTTPTDAHNYQAGDCVILDTGSGLTNGSFGFSGWSMTPGGTAVPNLLAMPAANTTLYAVWE